MTTKKTEKDAIPSFEESLDQLEAIVAEMEDGKLPLETLIVRYEAGSKLLTLCEQRLKEAELKIEILRNRDAKKPEFEALESET